ncbi:MAG: phosphoglycerate kinase [Parcubacteria group bacterium]|jgi:phosphoglycerate kinase|nr:phosphoglycerate kinase [Parcubacteria group bacterium]|tara:strand:+ start:4341 stop:5498 length:1158 start_codon:yes stop_codon:yes gene_type:complete
MKFLKDFNFKDKRVLVRFGFDVPLKDGQVTNDFRIRTGVPTIEYLLNQGAKVILLTHLGRPNGQVVEELRVDPIGQKLAQLIDKPVKKLDDCIGSAVVQAIEQMKSGQVILLENVQFHPGEKTKDPSFINLLASLADFFVFEAFGQAHRDYASISGLSKKMPSCAGLLLEKEIENLHQTMDKTEHPFVVIIGGVKISTKIKVIKNYLAKADNLILGGALANTVIRAKGFAIGKSIIEEEMVAQAEKLELTNNKLHIPVDVVASADPTGKSSSRIAPVGKTEPEEMILDIGPDTVHLFNQIIAQAKMIVWNGPMGLFEVGAFNSGSEQVARAVAQSSAFSLVGGGDTICLLGELDLLDKIDHVSTGGGAMLKFLVNEKLPGIEALK